ncbi:MAG: CoA-binding protein, partial [Deltaproteobacteria bacterium]|nr:CoA-binding protein [Deltaproteobacteria bacterium]
MGVMKNLFYPKSVVVFGASDSSTNMGRKIVENLDRFKFRGPVYLVGKNEGSLNDRKIYKHVQDIDD